MIESPILKEKYETQKRLDARADHNLKRYFENAHLHVRKMVEQFGLEIKYGEIEGGFLTPTHKEPLTTE